MYTPFWSVSTCCTVMASAMVCSLSCALHAPAGARGKRAAAAHGLLLALRSAREQVLERVVAGALPLPCQWRTARQRAHGRSVIRDGLLRVADQHDARGVAQIREGLLIADAHLAVLTRAEK